MGWLAAFVDKDGVAGVTNWHPKTLTARRLKSYSLIEPAGRLVTDGQVSAGQPGSGVIGAEGRATGANGNKSPESGAVNGAVRRNSPA